MAKIKSYTDLEQSRKLAEILPLESADMYYISGDECDICFGSGVYEEIADWLSNGTPRPADIPCWSLSALLSALRVFTTPTAFSVKVSTPSLIKTENGYKLIYVGDYTPMINNGLDTETPIESVADNPVDACYELILKLNELNLL